MLAVIDCRLSPSCCKALENLGFTLLSMPPFLSLAQPVASHPDMLIFPFRDRLFCHRAYYATAKTKINTILNASGLSLCLTDDMVSTTYPTDVRLNLVDLDGRILGKADAISKKVKEYAAQNQIPIVPVKQGYTKCSSVVLKRALITADKGIAYAAQSEGADVLLISPGGVMLPGYSHGFLGGACGIYRNTVFFCGNLDLHPEAAYIRSFCKGHGYNVVSLSEEPLLDAGTLFLF